MVAQENPPKMDKYNVSKKVYYAMMISFLPATAFCIPHGVVTSHLAPALGLIPQGIGAFLALYRSGLLRKKSSNHEYQIVLTNDGEDVPHNKITAERIFLAIADFAIMSGLIISIVFAFLTSSVHCYGYYYKRGYYRTCNDDGLSMLAAYGTVPMLFNAILHIYLIFHFIYYAAPKMCGGKKEGKKLVCSRCNIPIREGGKLGQEREEPTPSMESMA